MSELLSSLTLQTLCKHSAAPGPFKQLCGTLKRKVSDARPCRRRERSVSSWQFPKCKIWLRDGVVGEPRRSRWHLEDRDICRRKLQVSCTAPAGGFGSLEVCCTTPLCSHTYTKSLSDRTFPASNVRSVQHLEKPAVFGTDKMEQNSESRISWREHLVKCKSEDESFILQGRDAARTTGNIVQVEGRMDSSKIPTNSGTKRHTVCTKAEGLKKDSTTGERAETYFSAPKSSRDTSWKSPDLNISGKSSVDLKRAVHARQAKNIKEIALLQERWIF